MTGSQVVIVAVSAIVSTLGGTAVAVAVGAGGWVAAGGAAGGGVAGAVVGAGWQELKASAAIITNENISIFLFIFLLRKSRI